MSISWNKVEKIFRLFFPEFSNKVTWAVVIAGLALTSSSILESLIEAMFEETYNIDLFGENDALVGVCLVTLGLVHNIVLQREKTKIELSLKTPVDNSEQREHDKKLFEYLNEIMDEDTITNTFHCLETNHAYYFSRYTPIEKFMYEIKKSDNSYADEEINEAMEVIKSASEKFNSFLINNFSQLTHGTSDDFMCLHPYWNCDRGGIFGDRDQDIKYGDATKEMFQIINAYKVAYSTYRKLIKSKLAV